MQHAAGDAGTSERVAVRSTVTAAFAVVRHDLVDNLDHSIAEELGLVGAERITDEDEAIAPENLDGTLDLRRVENLDIPEPIIGPEILALLHNLWCVSVGAVPSELGVAFD
jgi:hypothetical protein